MAGLLKIGRGAIQSAQNAIVPIPFGPQRVTCIPVCAPAAGSLGADVTAGASALELSRKEEWDNFPISGSAVLGGTDEIAWNGKIVTGTGYWLLGVSGIAADQCAGADVRQLVEELCYVAACYPGTAQASASSLGVYADGTLKAAATVPVHTIYLSDLTVFMGHRATVLKIDQGTLAQFADPCGAPATVAEAVQQQQEQQYRMERRLIGSYTTGGYSNPGFFSANTPGNGAGAVSLTPMMSGTPQQTVEMWEDVRVPVRAGPAVPPPTSVAVAVPINTGHIGLLEIELSGVRDDTSGTYTGTASKLFREPVDIIRYLLNAVYGFALSTMQDASWARTKALQAEAGIAWTGFAFSGPPLREFLGLVNGQGHATLFLEKDGTWRYVFTEPAASLAVVDTLSDARWLEPGFRLQTVPRSAGRIVVTYGLGPRERTVTVDSEQGGDVVVLATEQAAALRTPWIDETAAARSLGAAALRGIDRDRQVGEVTVPWWGLLYSRLDIVQVSADWLTTYGTLAWRIRGLRYDPMTGRIEVSVVADNETVEALAPSFPPDLLTLAADDGVVDDRARRRRREDDEFRHDDEAAVALLFP